MFETQLTPEQMQANRRAMQPHLERLQELLAAREVETPSQARMKSRGKMLPRQRVRRLLDPQTPFLELSPWAALDMYNNECPGASLITGIGTVCGRPCMVIANDASIKGGAIYPATLKKHLRAQQIAAENGLLTLTLVESAGANLLYQAELFAESGGRVFANQARMSAAGIPQIALVFGSSTAGGAYIPGMSDYLVMVRNQARVFLGGPPLVKMATGEEIDEESLGGAELHARVSGVSDYTAEDDAHALLLGRQIVSSLPYPASLPRQGLAPRLDSEEMLSLISADPSQPLEIREILLRLVDDSQWLEFKPDFGSTLVCAQTRLGGHELGLIANNGILFAESAQKGAHFIQLCNQSRIPILFMHNITGFMVGSQAEREGIVKHGSKLVNAVSTSSVPHLTLIVGNSYGAGNYAMCGRAFEPRFLFTWPNARCAVMGGEQARGVLAQLGHQAEHLAEQFERESTAWYATARGWDDGVIDPRQTRQVLIAALSVCRDRQRGAPPYGVFRF